MLEISEDERRRFGRDLHDGLGQLEAPVLGWPGRHVEGTAAWTVAVGRDGLEGGQVTLHPEQLLDLAGGTELVYERHRHRYEVNNFLRRRLEAAGLVVSGTSPDERLVEVIELPDHPFFVASQYHPEFKSRPERPAPLFREFVEAALARARERRPQAIAEEHQAAHST